MVRDFKKAAAWLIGACIIAVKNVFQMQHGCCKFYPSCGEFAQEAINTLPTYKALLFIIIRILKCNPINSGGFDPVPEKRSLREGI
jgi:uncharacterized protein